MAEEREQRLASVLRFVRDAGVIVAGNIATAALVCLFGTTAGLFKRNPALATSATLVVGVLGVVLVVTIRERPDEKLILAIFGFSMFGVASLGNEE
jgi:predicted tellurium resistance membrane protein TerC